MMLMLEALISLIILASVLAIWLKAASWVLFLRRRRAPLLPVTTRQLLLVAAPLLAVIALQSLTAVINGWKDPAELKDQRPLTAEAFGLGMAVLIVAECLWSIWALLVLILRPGDGRRFLPDQSRLSERPDAFEQTSAHNSAGNGLNDHQAERTSPEQANTEQANTEQTNTEQTTQERRGPGNSLPGNSLPGQTPPASRAIEPAASGWSDMPNWRRIGWDPSFLFSDVWLGAVAFLAVYPLVTLVLRLLQLVQPEEVAMHPVVSTLQENPQTWVWVVAGLAVVLVAPVAEEFFFRGVLQGWLQTLEAQGSRPPRDQAPPGFWPVLLTSLIFAVAHSQTWPDPIALFLFSLVLGLLFQRTGRLWPSITTHICLNGLTFLLLALSASGVIEGLGPESQ